MSLLAGFFRGLSGFFRNLPELLRLLIRLPGQIILLLRYLFRICRHPPKLRCRCKNELDLPPEVHKRADPMLYSQAWLMSQGLSVTWDNPDIQLYRNGAAVASHQLQPNTAYEVQVRVWNNSYDAPAPGLPVHLSFLSFGAGASSTYLGKRIINLGAKGTLQCPAFASFKWVTPSVEGHYCLQASLVWADDANPNNNVGQENTNVGAIHSPALFEFVARNRASVRRRFIFEVDDYELPELPECQDPPKHREFRSRLEESRSRWKEAIATQGYGKFNGWTADWEVRVEPEQEILAPQEEIRVRVSIEFMRPPLKDSKAFNVNVFAIAENESPHHRQQVGGVTLYVEP